jgi:hypothetical protein
MVARNVTSGARGPRRAAPRRTAPRRAVPIPRRNPRKEIDFIQCTRACCVSCPPSSSCPSLPPPPPLGYFIMFRGAWRRVPRGFPVCRDFRSYRLIARGDCSPRETTETDRVESRVCDTDARLVLSHECSLDLSQNQLTIFTGKRTYVPRFRCIRFAIARSPGSRHRLRQARGIRARAS